MLASTLRKFKAYASGQRGAAGASMAADTAHRGASLTDLTMANWLPNGGSADADLLPELGRLQARSRDLARNNGLMSGYTQTCRDNIVGAVLRLSCQPEYRLLGLSREEARAWGNNVEAHFRSWSETTHCDAANTLNLLGLTHQVMAGSLLNGDALALPVYNNRPGSTFSSRIMVVESDRLCTPPWLTADASVRGGIRFDRFGAPVTYYIRRRHPGDDRSALLVDDGSAWGWEAVPAFTPWGRRRVLHLHDKERTGQSRGKPLVAAVMAEFKMAGDYASNELQASVANSLIAAFIESNLSPEAATALFTGDGEDGEQQTPRDAWGASVSQLQKGGARLRGGAMIPLPVGAKLSAFNPGRPNAAFEAFMLATLRHISAGLNIPYELLSKDFSRTTYSSARAALLEAWRYFNGRRRWLTDMWLRPIFDLWLEEAIDKGVIEAPGFYDNRYAWTRCRFIFGGRGWVDPVKEAQASRLRMETGVSTLEQECAEQGLDYEEVLDQRAVELRMMAERGLQPATSTAIGANEAEQKTETEERPAV